MVSTLAQNARGVGSIPALGTIFPIFNTPMTLTAVIKILYKLCAVRLLKLPLVYRGKYIVCMCVIVSINIPFKRVTISGGGVKCSSLH